MIQEYSINENEIDYLDKLLEEKIGIRIEHSPYLEEEFSTLLHETETKA